MARERDLPHWLSAVHPRSRVPHHAELVIGAIVMLIVITVDLRSAIGFSSFAVLVYYALANASASTLSPNDRRWPRWLSWIGLAGCGALAISLPATTLLAGACLFAIGIVSFALRRWRA